MNTFETFLAKIDNPSHRERTAAVLSWIQETYPTLETVIKWNQPMFTDHGTYIIGLSVSKKHLALAPESVTLARFTDKIKAAGYSYTDNLIRINWEQTIDYELLKEIINFNIDDKAEFTNFWR